MAREKILVVGSAHLDVFGDTDDKSTLDKKGKISFYVGGTAFNVATQLGIAGRNVFLYTYLRKDSLVARAIRMIIRRNRIDAKHVYERKQLLGEEIFDSAFVAHRDAATGDLFSAVSGMVISERNFHEDKKEAKKLDAAIDGSTLVVVECNLTGPTLSHILRRAAQKRKQVAVAAVSESKFLHYLEALPVMRRLGAKALLVSANMSEYAFALARDPDLVARLRACFEAGDFAAFDGARLCDLLNAESAVVSTTKGFALVTAQACCYVEAPHVPPKRIQSTSGAGDALLAAVLETYLELPPGESLASAAGADLARQKAHSSIGRTLRTMGSTPDASLSLAQRDLEEGRTGTEKFFFKVRDAIVGIVVEKGVEYGVIALVVAVTFIFVTK